MWHARKFIRPKQEPPRDSISGVPTRAVTALAYALHDLPAMVYGAVSELDSGQLQRLAKAASLINMAAHAELASRPRTPRAKG